MCRLEQRHTDLRTRENRRMRIAAKIGAGKEQDRHISASVRLWRKRNAVASKARSRGIDTKDW